MAYETLRVPLLLSISAALLTMALKTAAYLITASAGLLTDALESGVNLVAALVAYLSLRYAHRPADADHTYGHEKIEFFSSGVEGILVCVAGLGSIAYAVRHLVRPPMLEDLGLGMVLAGIASAVNLAVALVLLRVGRRHKSIILEADGHHLMSDVLTTGAVLLGLGLVRFTGWVVLDPVVAMLVGAGIAVTGLRLVRRSYDGLMDRAWSAEELAELRADLAKALPPGAVFHHVRTRRAGRRKYADFHLLIDGATTVREGHRLAHAIEGELRRKSPELELGLHLEPIEERDSWEPEELARLGEDTAPPAIAPVPPPIDD
jgi:cation diffusion facilitator family transporter